MLGLSRDQGACPGAFVPGSSLASSCSPTRDASLYALACCARRCLRDACDGGSGDQTDDASGLSLDDVFEVGRL